MNGDHRLGWAPAGVWAELGIEPERRPVVGTPRQRGATPAVWVTPKGRGHLYEARTSDLKHPAVPRAPYEFKVGDRVRALPPEEMPEGWKQVVCAMYYGKIATIEQVLEPMGSTKRYQAMFDVPCGSQIVYDCGVELI